MADVNWNKYHCDVCMAVGLVCAAVAAGIAAWLLSAAGFSAWLVAVLFLVLWGGLLKIVQDQCAQRAAQEAYEAARASASAEEAAPEAAADPAQPAIDDAPAAKEAADSVEKAAADPQAGSAVAAAQDDRSGEGSPEDSHEATRPETLDAPRGGAADDLKRIKGIGPKLESLCNALGFWHFDQIAGWSAAEVAWVDANLEGFKGRVTRDAWVAQASTLAKGGKTDFSKRVDDGDVPSSQ